MTLHISSTQPHSEIEKMNHATIIYGPQGCGKTVNAQALAAHYGKTRVIDYDGRTAPRSYDPDTLVLTNVPLPGAIHFDDAMRAADLASRSSPQTQRHEQSLEDRFQQSWSQKRFSIEQDAQAGQKSPDADLAEGIA